MGSHTISQRPDHSFRTPLLTGILLTSVSSRVPPTFRYYPMDSGPVPRVNLLLHDGSTSPGSRGLSERGVIEGLTMEFWVDS